MELTPNLSLANNFDLEQSNDLTDSLGKPLRLMLRKLRGIHLP
jgi:hypothetical protein